MTTSKLNSTDPLGNGEASLPCSPDNKFSDSLTLFHSEKAVQELLQQTPIQHTDDHLIEFSEALRTVAKALKQAAEGKAFAQAEAAEWKRRFELERAQNQQLEHKEKEILSLHTKVDLVVTLGGDGTVLWVPGILFTPICPHSLSFRPLILPEHVTIRVQVPFNSRSPAWASFDGKDRKQLAAGDALHPGWPPLESQKDPICRRPSGSIRKAVPAWDLCLYRCPRLPAVHRVPFSNG
ncbi:hypothetical protein NC652_002697 [Populus alba x Populus x berolinensis]|nr:hypothetical protein NC652_002697 [Populus alba x Populus x berolinensis]